MGSHKHGVSGKAVKNSRYKALVLAADPNWTHAANRVPEYEMSAPKTAKRIFYGYYRARGAYGSPE